MDSEKKTPLRSYLARIAPETSFPDNFYSSFNLSPSQISYSPSMICEFVFSSCIVGSPPISPQSKDNGSVSFEAVTNLEQALSLQKSREDIIRERLQYKVDESRLSFASNTSLLNKEDLIRKRLEYKVDESNLFFSTQSVPIKSPFYASYLANRAEKINSEVSNHRGVFTYQMLLSKIDKEDQEQLGKAALEETNKYRRSKGLKPLAWEPRAFKIGRILNNKALEHSLAMGENRVAFGHKGFKKRAQKIPFQHRKVGENVAYIEGVEKNKMAIEVVQGWIDSKGHRQNLEGDFNYCTIAVYKSPASRYYFTQLLIST